MDGEIVVDLMRAIDRGARDDVNGGSDHLNGRDYLLCTKLARVLWGGEQRRPMEKEEGVNN